MTRQIGLLIVLIMSIGISWMSSCTKDLEFSDTDRVIFTIDTLHMDTAFTAQAAPTARIKVFNPSHNKSVRIESLRLQHMDSSYYRINVDGKTGYELTNIELLPNDSDYIFLTLNIVPGAVNTPFYILDELIATTAAGSSSVYLDAYGQNAYYYRDSVISTNVHWTTEKPIVLIGDVLVDSGVTLTIDPGARVYVQSKAYLYVAGTLHADATLQDSILFQGNRLDRDYYLNLDVAGEWGGLVFLKSSLNNSMTHVLLKNATTAINLQFGASDNNPKLVMKQCQIANAAGYGILSFGSGLVLENCLLNSNNINLAFILGGKLYMNQCTLGGYSLPFNIHEQRSRSKSMILLNYFIDGNNQIQSANLNAQIYNSVIYGSLENEFVLDRVQAVSFDVDVDHCVVKSSKTLGDYQTLCNSFTNTMINEDPQFTDVSKWNYKYTNTSPLYRATSSNTLSKDIRDKPRSSTTDIGCYEID